MTSQSNRREDEQLLQIARCRSLGLTSTADTEMKRRIASMYDAGRTLDSRMSRILGMPSRVARCRYVASHKTWFDMFCTVIRSENVRAGSLVFLTTDAFVVNLAFGFQVNRKDIAIQIVQHCGRALEHVVAEFQDNVEVVLAAVRHSGDALRFASNDLRGNENVVLAAVKNDGLALAHAAIPLRDVCAVVEAAVRQSGAALEFASESLRDSPSVVMAAVQNDGLAIQFASDRLRNNIDIAMTAMGRSGTSLLWHSSILSTQSIPRNVFR